MSTAFKELAKQVEKIRSLFPHLCESREMDCRADARNDRDMPPSRLCEDGHNVQGRSNPENKIDSDALTKSAETLKKTMADSLPDIKRSIEAWVKYKDREKAQEVRFLVKDTRTNLDGVIRSDAMTGDTSKAQARADLVIVAKKLIKIERTLAFADDMLFANDILSELGGAIEFAETTIEDIKEAVKAIKDASRAEHQSSQYRNYRNQLNH